MFLYCLVLMMATMAHGGDAGGDPPPHGWHPASTHITETEKVVRGKAANNKLRAAFNRNNNQPLTIEFDTEYTQTNLPVGSVGTMLTSYIGSLLHHPNFPRYYESWDDVPEVDKTEIWIAIHRYFNMAPLLSDPEKRDKVVWGVNAVCGRLYKGSKYDFKKEFFKKAGGYDNVDNLRGNPPVDCTVENWDKFLDFNLRDKVRRRSVSNSANRAKQVVKSRHGSKSYASRLYEEKDMYPDAPQYIQNYRNMHMQPDGQWTHPVAQSNHDQMSSMSQSTPDISQEQVLLDVLGERRGHVRGKGPKTPKQTRNAGRPSSSSSSAGGATSRPPPASTGIDPSQFAAVLQRFAADNNLRITPDLLATLMSAQPPPPPSSSAGSGLPDSLGENENSDED